MNQETIATSIIKLEYPDSTTNNLSIFNSVTASPYVFIIFPALGVRASFYKTLAHKIAARGYHSVTVDWRGQGESSVRAQRGIDYGYRHLIADMKTAIEATKVHFPKSEPVLIGHSLGGQLGSLLISRYPELVNKMSIIAACSVYYKGWDGFARIQTWVVGRLFYRLAYLLGYFPGDKLGFGGREFPGVMKDWGNNAQTGKYDLIADDFNYEHAFQKVHAQIKSFSIEDDWLAPPKAMKYLTDKFGANTTVEYTHLSPDITGKKLNHFSWAKESDKVVDLLIDWRTKQ